MTEKNAELNRPRTGFAENTAGARLLMDFAGTERVVEVVMDRACRKAGTDVSSGNTALSPVRPRRRTGVRRDVPGCDLGAGSEAQPSPDSFDMRLGGALGDDEFVGDLPV